MLRTTRMGLACLLGATALLAACQRSQPADPVKPREPLRLDAQGEVQKQDLTLAAEATKAVVAPPEEKPSPAASSRMPPKPAPVKPAPLTLAPPTAPPVPPAAEKAPEVTEQRADEKRSEGQSGEDDAIVTTISGCLERSRSKFRLTDMIGEHAPKSRSWKTGFFRKGSAKLDLIAETDHLKLEPHVGYRVDVTGALFKKVMHARSLNPTSARCS